MRRPIFLLSSIFLLTIFGGNQPAQVQAAAFLPEANAHQAKMPLAIMGSGPGANSRPPPAAISALMNLQMGLLNGTMTNKQIREVAKQMSSLFSDQQLQMMKKFFAAFAPDSWVQAFNNFPPAQMRCIMRESMVLSLKKQMKLIQMILAARAGKKLPPAPIEQQQEEEEQGNESEEYYDGELAENSTTISSNSTEFFSFSLDGNVSEEEKALLLPLRAKCPRAFHRMAELSKLVNETIQKLPPRVLQILKNFTARAKGLLQEMKKMDSPATVAAKFKSTFTDILLALKSTTMEERQKVGDLFPKLRALITDPRIDQLLDLMIGCMFSADKKCKLEMKNLMGQILKDSGILKAFASIKMP